MVGRGIAFEHMLSAARCIRITSNREVRGAVQGFGLMGVVIHRWMPESDTSHRIRGFRDRCNRYNKAFMVCRGITFEHKLKTARCIHMTFFH
jgi:hypothetical protein